MYENFITKESFTQKDIQSIIDSKLEESIHIEFKSAGSLSLSDSKKKEIAKDISAFANSDGGIIFYGIKEDNHVASELSFIDGNSITKEWLENVITSRIQQKIESLKIFPVRFDNDINKSIYVVLIPRSNNSPHITCDKKYYKRYNFQSIPMEEYEVRNLYFQIREGSISIEGIGVYLEDVKEYDDNYIFNITINISNLTKHVAEKYRISCNIKAVRGTITSKKNYLLTEKDEGEYKLSTIENIPIFPSEVLSLLNFTISLPINSFDVDITLLKVDVYTYSTGEFNEYCYDMKNIMIDLVNKMKNVKPFLN